jgi:PAS domain S-box-containing protein
MRRGRSIRTQVLMVPFIALFGFLSVMVIVVVGLEMQQKNSRETLNNLVLLDKIREIEKHMNAARSAEKDFLIDPKFQYVLQHRQVLDEFSVDINWLIDQNISEQLRERSKVWSTKVQDYEKAFLDMEAEVSKIGYTENSGLKGSMTLAADVVENWLTGDKPRKVFFKLRDLEHRYILEPDMATLEKWRSSLREINAIIPTFGYSRQTREIILTALDQYALAFNDYADLSMDLVDDSEKVEILSEALSADFAKALARYNATSTKTALTGLQKFQQFASYVFAVTFVIGVLVFLLSRRISAKISEPLTTISETMIRLAEGELDAPIPSEIYQREINQVVGSVKAFRDASLERRVARFQLSEANKQTQKIIRSMREALFETDAQGQIRMANPAAERLLGVNSGDLIGKKLQQFFGRSHALSNKERLEAIRAVLKTERAASQDCTKILNQSPLPILLIKEDGTIISANENVSDLTGYLPGELSGQNVIRLIPRKKHKKHTVLMKKGSTTKGLISIAGGRVFPILCKDGSKTEISLVAIAVGTSGDPEYMCVICQPGIDCMAESSPENLPERVLRDFGFDDELDVGANLSQEASNLYQWVVHSDGRQIPIDYSGALLRNGARDVTGAIYVVRDISEQLQAEKELNQFKSTLERVSSEIYMFDPENLQFFYANRAALDGAAMTMDELSGLTPMDLTPGLNEEKFRKRLQPLIEGKTDTVRYETEKPKGGGALGYEEVFIQLIDLDGKSPRFIAFVTDITSRREAEVLLDRFKATLDSTSDAVFMFKPDTLEFVFLNDEAKVQTGWSGEEYLHKTPADINPMFSTGRFRMLTAPLVYGTQRTVMLTTTGLNGNSVEITVELFHPDNSDPWFTVTMRDISKRLEAESQIKKFKKTLDQSQDEIYMFHPDTLELTYMNNMAKDICEIDKKGYCGLTLMDINHNFNKSIFLERAESVLDGRKKQIVYQSINKANRPVEVSLQIVKSADSTKQFVLIANDISERLAADKAKSQFISTVSHELRTPLTSIKGVLGIIHAGAVGKVDAKTDELISMAMKNSDRLERLIDDILDTEKIEAGQMDFFFEPVDLSELVSEALSANEGYAETHNVSFVAKGIDKPVVISGDSGRLMQILANLMSNAAKFSNAGDKIEVSLNQDGHKVRLSVKDHGCGIPKSAQPTIFDKFTQADSSDQRGKGGTGLGLSIVKMMVQAHGGTIDFVSQKGKGSEFFADFDLLEPENSENTKAA